MYLKVTNLYNILIWNNICIGIGFLKKETKNQVKLQKEFYDIYWSQINNNKFVIDINEDNFSDDKNYLNIESLDEEIKTSINSTKNLWKQNLSLLDKNNHIQSELSILQEISEDTPNKIREELILYRTQNEKYKEEINKQKEKIIKLQKNLNNIRRNNYHQDASTEIYVTAPNKKNVECLSYYSFVIFTS